MRSSLTHFLIAILVAVVALAVYGAGYIAVSNKSVEVASLQGQITAASAAMSRTAAARAALAEIAGDEANVRSYFVSENNVVAFINDLEARGLAQKATVSVLSVATGGTPTRPTLTLALTVKGSFDAVMRTIGVIEYAPYDAEVSALSVGQDPKNGWQATLTLVVGSVPATNDSTAATSTP